VFPRWATLFFKVANMKTYLQGVTTCICLKNNRSFCSVFLLKTSLNYSILQWRRHNKKHQRRKTKSLHTTMSIQNDMVQTTSLLQKIKH
jgi:hypothetical protein